MAKKRANEHAPKKTRYRSTFYWEGKQYEAASSKSQADADKKAALKEDKLKRGEVGISSNMTVKRWANEWLETYKKPVLAEKQYKDYKSTIDNIIVPAIGHLRLVDVKDVHLQKILNDKAGYSASRMRMLHIRIKAIFRQARLSRLIMYDPSEALVMPAATAGERRSITDHEREHFLKAAQHHHAGLMFKVMLYCGLRTGEVVALDWRDIDFDDRRIKVTRAMESGTDIIKEPKTKAGIREVPIPDEIYQELLAIRGGPFEPVFLQERGKVRHTHSSRRKAWDSLKKQIDISMGATFKVEKGKPGKSGPKKKVQTLSIVAPDFVPYCLRHTYCTDLQDKGVPINIAKYLMGHSDISVTASIYTHISDKAIEEAAELINGKKDGKNKKESKKTG